VHYSTGGVDLDRRYACPGLIDDRAKESPAYAGLSRVG
jgi:hypothetical protein